MAFESCIFFCTPRRIGLIASVCVVFLWNILLFDFGFIARNKNF